MWQINMYGSRSTCLVTVIILCLSLLSGAAFSDDNSCISYEDRYYEAKSVFFLLVSYQATTGFGIQQTFPVHLWSLLFLVFEDDISASHYNPLDS